MVIRMSFNFYPSQCVCGGVYIFFCTIRWRISLQSSFPVRAQIYFPISLAGDALLLICFFFSSADALRIIIFCCVNEHLLCAKVSMYTHICAKTISSKEMRFFLFLLGFCNACLL